MLYSRPSSVANGKQLDQNGSTYLTPTMQAGQDSEGGGVVANKCVCCMQWWCCVFVFGLEFCEVASKVQLDILIRELCKITGVLWILSGAHALVLSLSLTLCLCVYC
jgi:hypothetical protein